MYSFILKIYKDDNCEIQMSEIMEYFNKVTNFWIFTRSEIQKAPANTLIAYSDFLRTWYNCEDQIRIIAAAYPEFLIELEGISVNDQSDWFVIKAKGNKVKRAKAELITPWELLEEENF